MANIEFFASDFNGKFNDYDRLETLPTLAAFILGLTDHQMSDREAKALATALAQDYLPLLRGAVRQYASPLIVTG